MRILIAFLLALTVAVGAFAPVPAAGEEKYNKVMIVLDASGSMNGRVDGQPKIIAARKVIAELLKNWDKSIQVGLTAYGHRKKGDCGDIETLVPVGAVDRAAIVRAVNALNPKGKTPLSKAVELAATEMKYTEERATVILVSDGKETCNADPCAVGAALEKAGVDFTAHVIGFDVTGEEAEGLNCLARSTGGEYITAKNTKALRDALRRTVKKVKEQAKKDPAAGKSNIQVVPVLGPGGPAVDIGLQWSLQQIGGESGNTPIEIKDRLATHLTEALPPGKYRVTGKTRRTRGEIEFEVVKGGPAKFELPLHAGGVNLLLAGEGGKPLEPGKYNAWMTPLDESGKQLKEKQVLLGGGFKSPIVLPPGRYLVSASTGPIVASETITLDVGQIVDVRLVLASGVLTVRLLAAPGKLVRLEDNFWVSVHAVGDDGVVAKKGAKAVYNSHAGAIPKFRLAPGNYRVSSRIGAVRGSEDVVIAAGKKKSLDLVLPTGRVALTAVDEGGAPRGCDGDNIWWSAYKIGDNGPSKKRQALKSGWRIVFLLPPGRHFIRVSCNDDVGKSEVDLKAGDEISVKVTLKPPG